LRPPVSDRALRQLEAVYNYIARDDAKAALRVVDRILNAVDLLQKNPYMGRESELRRQRELVADQYVLIYSVHRDGVLVHSLTHGTRRK
jgi:toxin ParE1/3/4